MVAEGLLRDGALGGKDAWLAFWRSCMGWLEPESRWWTGERGRPGDDVRE